MRADIPTITTVGTIARVGRRRRDADHNFKLNSWSYDYRDSRNRLLWSCGQGMC
jgi:hypothetical protein